MPALTADTQFAPLPAEPVHPDIGLAEQAGAAFATGTFTGRAIGAYAASKEREGLPADPDFNVLDHLTPDELSEPRIYGRAQSMDDLQLIREQERRYNSALELSASGPVNPIVLSLAVNAVDPVNWMGLGISGGATAATRVLAAAGENALLGGGVTAAQAAFDPHVSASDVAISAAAAGSLGAFVRGVGELAGRTNTAARLTTVARDALAPLNDQRTVINGALGGSASAAENTTRIADELTAQVSALKFGTKTGDTGLLPAIEELANSDIPIVRYLAAEMYDSGTVHEGALIGERIAGTSLHTLGLRDYAQLSELTNAIDLAYNEGRRSGGIPKKMTRAEFSSELGLAMAEGDTHAFPAIADVAKALRKDLLEPMRERVTSSGLTDIPGPPKGDKSYFPHMYLVDQIERGKRDHLGRTFVEAVADHIATTEPKHADFAKEIAEEVAAKIIKHGEQHSGQLPRLSLAARGPLKERTLEIPFTTIRPWLNTSADFVLARYIRSVAPDVRLHEQYGTLDPAKAFNERVNQQANVLRTAIEADASLSPGAREKKLADLAAHEKRMLSLLHFGFEELRGMRPPSSASKAGKTVIRAAKALSFIKALPLVPLAQLPDLGNTIMNEGLTRTLGGFLDTMLQSLRGLKTEALRELQRAGTGLEYQLNTRTNALLGLASDFDVGDPLDRGVASVSNYASKLFLINTITAGTKSIAGGAISTRILDSAVRIADKAAELAKTAPDVHPDDLAMRAARDVLSPADLRRMAEDRLSPSDMVLIGGQRKHFTRSPGVLVANSENWTDASAMAAYRHAMATATERAVITPHALDAPMWATSQLGSIVAMYQRFMYAAYHRIMVAGMQRRDASALIGAASMLAMGAISIAGRDVAQTGGLKERTPAQWVRESIDRSGLVSAFFALENIGSAVGLPTSETLVGHGGEKPGTTIKERYKSTPFGGKGPVEKLNPIAGYLSDAAAALGVAKKASTGDQISERELNKATQMIPFRRMMGVSLLFDQLEHAGARQGWWKPLPDSK